MGSSSKQSSAPQQQAQAPNVPPQAALDTTSWGGMGRNIPQNAQSMGAPATGIGTQAPSWMQGQFAAPWWGQQAPDVGAAIMQQNAGQNPGAPQSPQSGVAGMLGNMTEEEIMALIQAEMAKQSQSRQPQQQASPYAQDRDWMGSVGVPMGLNRYTGMQEQGPGASSQEDQAWLQANHPWAAARR